MSEAKSGLDPQKENPHAADAMRAAVPAARKIARVARAVWYATPPLTDAHDATPTLAAFLQGVPLSARSPRPP